MKIKGDAATVRRPIQRSSVLIPTGGGVKDADMVTHIEVAGRDVGDAEAIGRPSGIAEGIGEGTGRADIVSVVAIYILKIDNPSYLVIVPPIGRPDEAATIRRPSRSYVDTTCRAPPGVASTGDAGRAFVILTHHINLLTTIAIGNEGDAATIGRPNRRLVAGIVGGKAGRVATIRIHYINLRIPVA